MHAFSCATMSVTKPGAMATIPNIASQKQYMKKSAATSSTATSGATKARPSSGSTSTTVARSIRSFSAGAASHLPGAGPTSQAVSGPVLARSGASFSGTQLKRPSTGVAAAAAMASSAPAVGSAPGGGTMRQPIKRTNSMGRVDARVRRIENTAEQASGGMSVTARAAPSSSQTTSPRAVGLEGRPGGADNPLLINTALAVERAASPSHDGDDDTSPRSLTNLWWEESEAEMNGSAHGESVLGNVGAPKDKIVVAVRVRPLAAKEKALQKRRVLRTDDCRVMVAEGNADLDSADSKGNMLGFVFDFVHDDGVAAENGATSEESQAYLYDRLGASYLMQSFEGYNVTIFAYGQTGAGKTYSMMGDDSWECRGLIPRLAVSLFSELEAQKIDYGVEVSYLEIYQEQVRDLLSTYVERQNKAPGEGHPATTGRAPWASISSSGAASSDRKPLRRSTSGRLLSSKTAPITRDSKRASSAGKSRASSINGDGDTSDVGEDSAGAPGEDSAAGPASADAKRVSARGLVSARASPVRTSNNGGATGTGASAGGAGGKEKGDKGGYVGGFPWGSAPAAGASAKEGGGSATGGSQGPRESLRVREHPKKGPYVEGLTAVKIRSWEELVDVLVVGAEARTMAATVLNEHSSRSHTIFSMTLVQHVPSTSDDSNHATTERVSKINLVDLAGSERQNRTNATGRRLTESCHINRSLASLNDVITQLARGSDFVQYRNSALTWLLKESLGGNSKTLMIASVSPAVADRQETLSTLRYANRAKRIHNRPVVNEDPREMLIRALRDEVTSLRNFIQGLANEGAFSGLGAGGSRGSAGSGAQKTLMDAAVEVSTDGGYNPNAGVGEAASGLSVKTGRSMGDTNSDGDGDATSVISLNAEGEAGDAHSDTDEPFTPGFSTAITDMSRFRLEHFAFSVDKSTPFLLQLFRGEKNARKRHNMTGKPADGSDDRIDYRRGCGWMVHFIRIGVTRIGSALSSDVILPGIGAEHCEIIYIPPRQRTRASGCVILRPSSSVPTYVNKREVARHMELYTGDRVCFGRDGKNTLSGPVMFYFDPACDLSKGLPYVPLRADFNVAGTPDAAGKSSATSRQAAWAALFAQEFAQYGEITQETVIAFLNENGEDGAAPVVLPANSGGGGSIAAVASQLESPTRAPGGGGDDASRGGSGDRSVGVPGEGYISGAQVAKGMLTKGIFGKKPALAVGVSGAGPSEDATGVVKPLKPGLAIRVSGRGAAAESLDGFVNRGTLSPSAGDSTPLTEFGRNKQWKMLACRCGSSQPVSMSSSPAQDLTGIPPSPMSPTTCPQCGGFRAEMSPFSDGLMLPIAQSKAPAPTGSTPDDDIERHMRVDERNIVLAPPRAVGPVVFPKDIL
eukprot:jgi/Mesvir1/19009/Mv12777-RA.1